LWVSIQRRLDGNYSESYIQRGDGTGMSKKSIKSNLARIDRMKDTDIDYSDIPPLDKTLLKKATTAWPPAKKQLTIRLDADVLDWLKGHGKGYQTRINRILRVVMESQPPQPVHR